MNTTTMKQNIAIEINNAALATGVFYKNKHVVNNVNYWHKFIIHNTQNLSRNACLRAVLDHVHPLDLIPVCFKREEHAATFLARNCGAAIEKLCKDNLIVKSSSQIIPLKLTIILRFSSTSEFKIDVQRNTNSVLQKRYDPLTKTLNLVQFHEDPDLSEFCPLSQPKIMFFVLHLSKCLVPPVESYILSNNLIKILNPLDALTGIKICHIDLRNNLLASIEDIGPLRNFHVTEIFLDGNPLCEKLDVCSYIEGVKKICPKIEWIDGIKMREANSIPMTKTNFLCNPDGYDLVNQFLEYFFTVYDSRNRQTVEALYHTNAMFSLTASYLIGQLSSSTAQLKHYNNKGRNILRMADFSRNADSLIRGSTNIINVFSRLPATEHDPYSFKVDLLYYTTRCAIVSVCGVFRERPESLLDNERILGFTRTFAIETMPAGHCVIVNEQLHVYNALNLQQIESFRVSRPEEVSVIPHAPNAKEQQQLADTLRIITNLNTDWSRKCLEECHYDLKKALILFVDLYKVDRIPSEAFLTSKVS